MATAKRSKAKKEQFTTTVAQPTGNATHEIGRPLAISPVLSKGQLNTLILLSFGVSRILQLASARSHSQHTQDSNINESCTVHLGETACQDASVLPLLAVKYESALFLLSIAMAVILSIWSSSQQLLRLNSLFVVTPLFLIVSALSLLHALSPATKSSNILVAALLMLLAAPIQVDSVPFLHKRRSQWSQGSRLPSLTLVVLIIVRGHTILDATTRCLELLQPSISLPENSAVSKLPTDSPVLTITAFLLIDIITEVTMYFFAWYEFERSQQRTLMFFLAFIYGARCYTLYNRDEHSSETSLEQLPSETKQSLILAALCAFAWMGAMVFEKPRSKVH